MQLLAIPLGFGMFALTGLCWELLGASLQFSGDARALVLVWLVLSFPALIVVHELLHAIVHPRLGRSRDTIIGLWPGRLLFYAHYSGPLTRERFLAVFAMPFLVITVLPLALAALGLLPPGVRGLAAWFSTWNALFACGDYIGFALLFAQIPRRAIVQNQGWRTYWRHG